jgi:hypothetical protein
VETASDADRAARMVKMPSVRRYSRIKEWGPTPAKYAFSTGEVLRAGRLVPERYLDDRDCLKGTRLKLLCRLSCLPVMDRVGREVRPKWPKQNRVCFACGCGRVEDVHHFVMECPRYAARRAGLVEQIDRILSRSTSGMTGPAFADMSSYAQCEVILGKRIDDPIAENRIDSAVKRYLVKAWNLRADVTAGVNDALGTTYEVGLAG